jgi:hypothetical protein
MRKWLPVAGLALAALVMGKAVRPMIAEAIDPQQAAVAGVVFEDRNGNDRQDPGERGVQGVSVSDGVKTRSPRATAAMRWTWTSRGGSPTSCSSPSRPATPCRPTST